MTPIEIIKGDTSSPSAPNETMRRAIEDIRRGLSDMPANSLTPIELAILKRCIITIAEVNGDIGIHYTPNPANPTVEK